MSNFAQIITSFERTGAFPLEANYIFSTVEDLKEFYADEVQAAMLHKGLLKVVENNGNGKQALYWVVRNTETDSLEFVELLTGVSIEDLEAGVADLLEKLNQEIEDRKQGDYAIWGTNNPDKISTTYNSVYKLAEQLSALQEAFDTHLGDNEVLCGYLHSILGSDETDIDAYLETLPYHSITEIANELYRYEKENNYKKLWHKIEGDPAPSEQFQTLAGVEQAFLAHVTVDTTAHTTLREEMNNLEIGVGLDSSGAYSPDSSTHYLQSSTSVMNALKTLDNILYRANIYVDREVIVDEAYYDGDTSTITMVFDCFNHKTQTVEIEMPKINNIETELKQWETRLSDAVTDMENEIRDNYTAINDYREELLGYMGISIGEELETPLYEMIKNNAEAIKELQDSYVKYNFEIVNADDCVVELSFTPIEHPEDDGDGDGDNDGDEEPGEVIPPSPGDSDPDGGTVPPGDGDGPDEAPPADDDDEVEPTSVKPYAKDLGDVDTDIEEKYADQEDTEGEGTEDESGVSFGREETITLYADVRISEEANNILERRGNALMVEGIAEKISCGELGDLQSLIVSMLNRITELEEKVAELTPDPGDEPDPDDSDPDDSDPDGNEEPDDDNPTGDEGEDVEP